MSRLIGWSIGLTVWLLLLYPSRSDAQASVPPQPSIAKAAQYIVDYGQSELAPASFVVIDVATRDQPAGLYYDLGRIRRGSVTTAADDVLAEIVLQQAWLLSVQKAFSSAFPKDDFWKPVVARAQATLDGFASPDNRERKDQDVVDRIQMAMGVQRNELIAAVREHATQIGKKAYSNTERGLAADKYNVAVITDPPGAKVGYLSIDEAALQVARRGVKFPDGISYVELVTSSADLGGSYVFRVQWTDGTKYFPGIRVTKPDTIRLARNPR